MLGEGADYLFFRSTMTTQRLLLLALLAPLLVACEQDSAPKKVVKPVATVPAEKPPEQTVVVQPPVPEEAELVPEALPDPAGAIEPEVSEPLEPVEAADSPEITYQPPVKPKPKAPIKPKEPEKPKLDLSLPKDLLKELNEAAVDEPTVDPLLPPLFVPEDDQPSKYQLSGKLHTNDDDDEYLHSIDGAELQIEIKQ